MALRPARDLAIRTARDDQRAREMEEARRHWAEVDAQINDALDASATISVIDLEADP